MTLVAMYQYGLLLFNEQYDESDIATYNYVSDKLARMLLATQLMGGPASIVSGKFLDKIRIWPVILTIAGFEILLLSGFYYTSTNLVGAELTAGERGSIL